MSQQTEEKKGLEQIYKCPGCNCFFLTKKDLSIHHQAFPAEDHMKQFKTVHKRLEHDQDAEGLGTWYPSKYGGDEWVKPVEKDPELANKLKIHGPATMGKYTYKLNGKWIIKRPATGY
jgi:uncharacterized C2H2 Zn-finger protein